MAKVNLEFSRSQVVNFDDADIKAGFVAKVMMLMGLYKVSIVRHRPTRSNQQNAWYWSCVLPTVVQGIADTHGESITSFQAHEAMKNCFLSKRIGDFLVPLQPRATTTTLTTKEFSDYIENISKLCAEYFGLVVPSPMQIDDSDRSDI